MTAWIAVPDISLDEFLAWIVHARDLHPDPRWVSPYDVGDSAPCVFEHAGHIVLFLGDNTGERESALASSAFSQMIALQVDERNSWSELVGYANGALAYSIYGGAEDDHVRVTGTPPDAEGVAELLARDHDCDEVAVELARVLLDLDIADVHPQRVVRLAPLPFKRALVAANAPEIRVAPSLDGDPNRGPLAVETDADWPGLVPLARSPTAIVVRTTDGIAYWIDVTTWPPRFTPLASDKVEAAAFTSWGTLILALEDEESTRNMLVEVASPTDPNPRWHRLPFEQAALVRDVGGVVVVFPAPWTDGDVRPHLLARDGRLQPLDLAPPETDQPPGDSCAVGFGDGEFLVQWLGVAYRWRAGSLAQLEALAIDDRLDSTCRARDGSVFALDANAGLVRVAANGAITPLDLDTRYLDHPTAIVHGPRDALIVKDMDRDAACKLFWPSSNAVTPVSWTALALDSWDPELIYYDAARDRLVVIAQHVHAASWSELAAGVTRG